MLGPTLETIEEDALGDSDDRLRCSYCDGLLQYIGCLGRQPWFRCRDCGQTETLEEG